jgi:flagellar hook-length control protein FliK
MVPSFGAHAGLPADPACAAAPGAAGAPAQTDGAGKAAADAFNSALSSACGEEAASGTPGAAGPGRAHPRRSGHTGHGNAATGKGSQSGAAPAGSTPTFPAWRIALGLNLGGDTSTAKGDASGKGDKKAGDAADPQSGEDAKSPRAGDATAAVTADGMVAVAVDAKVPSLPASIDVMPDAIASEDHERSVTVPRTAVSSDANAERATPAPEDSARQIAASISKQIGAQAVTNADAPSPTTQNGQVDGAVAIAVTDVATSPPATASAADVRASQEAAQASPAAPSTKTASRHDITSNSATPAPAAASDAQGATASSAPADAPRPQPGGNTAASSTSVGMPGTPATVIDRQTVAEAAGPSAPRAETATSGNDATESLAGETTAIAAPSPGSPTAASAQEPVRTSAAGESLESVLKSVGAGPGASSFAGSGGRNDAPQHGETESHARGATELSLGGRSLAMSAAISLIASPDGTLRLASATAAPLTVAPILREPPVGNLDQMVQTMRVMVKDSVSEATVHLHPEQFGEVSIQVRVDGKSVSAIVHAESAGVREWLQGQESTLRNGLSEHGLQLDRLVVQRDGRQDRRQNAPSQQQGQPRRRLRGEQDPQQTFELTV